jgi:Fumarase C C-terminus
VLASGVYEYGWQLRKASHSRLTLTGYDKASAIAHGANDEGTTRREVALASEDDADEFDRIVVPATMVGDPLHDPRVPTWPIASPGCTQNSERTSQDGGS